MEMKNFTLTKYFSFHFLGIISLPACERRRKRHGDEKKHQFRKINKNQKSKGNIQKFLCWFQISNHYDNEMKKKIQENHPKNVRKKLRFDGHLDHRAELVCPICSVGKLENSKISLMFVNF